MWKSPPWPPRTGRVLVIAGGWTLAGVIGYVNSFLLIGDLIRMGKLEGSYAFLPDFAATVVIGLVAGLLGGYLLVYKLNTGRRHKTFMSDIVRSGVLFTLIYVGTGVVLVFTLAFAAEAVRGDVWGALSAGWHNVVLNVYTPSFLSTYLVWGLLVVATQFMLQVSDKFGPGVLWKLMTGRYYQPREEERIFMFLDLRSSTAIAESLGHRRFFELLRELYQDITWPVTSCAGEIYQYVGDEVIVSWAPQTGIRDSNCLRCFFAIEGMLSEKRSDYLARFGVEPTFKAGVHYGPATVGEIGVVKKDIVFSGEVLNTTARIQAECNRHRVNLLVSSELLERMRIDDHFHSLPIGEIPLRGKAEPLALSVVLPA